MIVASIYHKYQIQLIGVSSGDCCISLDHQLSIKFVNFFSISLYSKNLQENYIKSLLHSQHSHKLFFGPEKSALVHTAISSCFFLLFSDVALDIKRQVGGANHLCVGIVFQANMIMGECTNLLYTVCRNTCMMALNCLDIST